MSNPLAIDAQLVRALVASQFPAWSELEVVPVEPNGWDNRTFRLGSDKSVRLPSHERYAPQVEKEHRWLPRLAPHLPYPIPRPIELGAPGLGFPLPWSVYAWLEGETVAVGRTRNLEALASDLADFLRALHRIGATEGPRPGRHNFFRGGPPATYDEKTRAAIEALHEHIDQRRALALWERALASEWRSDPVWLHGDLVSTNILVRAGRLSAVIDFGVCGVGDPACDLAIAWTFFHGESRTLFRRAVGLDPETWARARGWALWKRAVALATDPSDAESQRVIEELLADHEAEA